MRTVTLAIAVLLVVICSNSFMLIVNGQTSGTSTISGTIYCNTDCSLVGLSNGAPIQSSGQVQAFMTEAINPSTGQPDPTLPTTTAQTTFDASANGRYELQGLSPGIYDLYASASGYPLILAKSGVVVHAGQSITINIYMTPTGATPEFSSPSASLFIMVVALLSALLFARRSRYHRASE